MRHRLIVSGKARGVDTCAQHGCTGGALARRDLASTGVDVAYLKENKKLAEDILATGGALVSEGQMGTFPGAAESARRSRILAQSHFSPAAF